MTDNMTPTYKQTQENPPETCPRGLLVNKLSLSDNLLSMISFDLFKRHSPFKDFFLLRKSFTNIVLFLAVIIE